MKKVLALVALALAAPAAAVASTPDTWRAGPNMTTARLVPAVVQLADGRVLFVGSGSIGPTSTSAEIYSPTTNAFSATAGLNFSRGAPLAVTLSDGRVLVAGGDPSEQTAEVYDPGANTWTQTTNDMRDSRGGGFPNPPPGTATALPNGAALVAGGSGVGGVTARADLYVAGGANANSFTPAADMSTPRSGAAAAPLPGGKVLVVGGVADSAGGSPASESGEVYDPGSNTWTPVGNAMSVPRYGGAAVPLPDGRVLVFGGATAVPSGLAPTLTTATDIYDPATNRFTPTGPLLSGVFSPAVAPLADGRVVAVGGVQVLFGAAGAGVATQVYEPAINGWVAGAIPLSITDGGGATLPDGDVLAADFEGLGATAPTQLYTPATVPGPPPDVGAQAANGAAIVTWGAAADNGRPIVGYTVRASNGTTVTTGDARTHAAMAVPSGVPVTFTVTAINDLGAGPVSAPSAAVTPSGLVTTPDTIAPTLKITKLKSKLKLKSFLKGVTATVTASESASLSIDVLASARRITIARAYNVVLASKNYGRATTRKVKVKPSRKLVGHAKKFTVRVRFTATDAAGNHRTVTKTIKVSG